MSARANFRTQISVRLDAEGIDRLDLVIERLEESNPELTVDDCIDAIFAIGLISTYSTMTVVEALKVAA